MIEEKLMRRLNLVLLWSLLGLFLFVQNATALPYQVEVGDYINLEYYNNDPEIMAGVMGFDVKDENHKTYGFVESFCMEYTGRTNTYTDYEITSIVDGIGFWDSRDWKAITYLYYNWDQGTLGFNASQSDLQRAFWYFTDGLTNVSDTVMQIVKYASSESANWINDGKVMVAVNDGQDILVSAAPVPEPATMLLFGTGLIGLAGLSRKKFIS